MRLFIMALALVLAGFASGTFPAEWADGIGVVAAAQQPSVPSEIDVDINAGGGSAWYANPVIIGIGVIALVALLVALTRGGGGTTIVKD
jgi:hypothetical protein